MNRRHPGGRAGRLAWRATLVCALALLLARPSPAPAQPAAFAQALADFTDAVEGTYGDEGARVGPALEQMSRALDEWDRGMAAAEARVAAAPGATPAARVDERLMLARMYADRGRAADALRELEAISGIAPERADVHVLRALLLEASGRSGEADDAYRRAAAADPRDPVAAYYLLRPVPGSNRRTAPPPHARDALETAFRGFVSGDMKRSGMPFPEIGIFADGRFEAPLLPFAAYAAGYADLVRGDYGGAVNEFRTGAAGDRLVTDPAHDADAFRRATAALRQGRLADARSLVEQSGVLGASSEAHRVLGLVYWAQGDADRSIEHLRAAIRANAGDERSRILLSRVLGSAGRDDEAERVLRETMETLPGSSRAQWWLASMFERHKRLIDAREAFVGAAGGAVAGRNLLYRAIAKLASGAPDFPAAIDWLARAAAVNPNAAVIHEDLATALAGEDRVDEAFAEFVAALLVDARDAVAYAGIGRLYLAADRRPEAIAALRRAAQLAPADTEIRYALATALVRAGRSDEAAPYFESVKEEQGRALAERRRTLSLDVMKEEAALRATEGDSNRAVSLWQGVIARDEPRASNHLSLARVLADAGRIDAAIEQFEKALSLGADPAVFLQLADVYARAGRAPDAARARVLYEQALRGEITKP